MPRIIASIEARMGSSRLPGKVLADVCGRPALSRLLDRLRACTRLDGIILATSTAAADDALADWAARENVPCYRGSEDDVLNRVVRAQQQMRADLVVEVTGDSILTDPVVLDWGVASFLANPCDIVTNVKVPSFPMGVDVQVYPLALLEQVEETVDDPAVREHVTLHFYEHPEAYRTFHLLAPSPWEAPTYRFQLDYPEDLAFIRAIYERLEPSHGPVFGLREIMPLLRREPELLELNIHCEEKTAR